MTYLNDTPGTHMIAVAKDIVAPLVVLLGDNNSGKTEFYRQLSETRHCAYFDHVTSRMDDKRVVEWARELAAMADFSSLTVVVETVRSLVLLALRVEILRGTITPEQIAVVRFAHGEAYLVPLTSEGLVGNSSLHNLDSVERDLVNELAASMLTRVAGSRTHDDTAYTGGTHE